LRFPREGAVTIQRKVNS